MFNIIIHDIHYQYISKLPFHTVLWLFRERKEREKLYLVAQLIKDRPDMQETQYPLLYSWSYRVAQTIKNLSAMRETWVQSLS